MSFLPEQKKTNTYWDYTVGKQRTVPKVVMDEKYKTNDFFDLWLKKLPKERSFSKSKIDDNVKPLYKSWRSKYNLEETDDYDLRGAFLSGQKPNKQGHLASFGNDGKLLKSPKHETVWKTAFTEIYHDYTGVYPEISDEMTREEANQIIDELIKSKHGDAKIPEIPWSY
jgi:hypothetical protein